MPNPDKPQDPGSIVDWNGLEDRRAPNQITARAIENAVAAGIQAAVSDPNTWNLAGQAMRQQAEAHAGGWLMAGIKAALTKVAWVSVIFLGVYMLGGWGAVVSLLKGQGIGKP
jgi:hypothetical protein